MYIREAQCEDVGAEIACLYAPGPGPSRITLAVTKNHTYYIFVDREQGSGGTFSLKIRPPSECDAPTVIPADGGTVYGTMAGAYDAVDSACGGSFPFFPDRVFQWTPKTFSALQGVRNERVVSKFRDGDYPDLLGEICNDNAENCGPWALGGEPPRPVGSLGSRIEAPVNAGDAYYIVVSGYREAPQFEQAQFNLKVIPPMCPDDGNPCTGDIFDDKGQCTHPLKSCVDKSVQRPDVT